MKSTIQKSLETVFARQNGNNYNGLVGKREYCKWKGIADIWRRRCLFFFISGVWKVWGGYLASAQCKRSITTRLHK